MPLAQVEGLLLSLTPLDPTLGSAKHPTQQAGHGFTRVMGIKSKFPEPGGIAER